MTPNDKALVAGVSDKSREALGEIYRRYGGAVWSVAKRVCRDRGRAEQVCQAVFNELWNAPDRFDQSRGTLRSCLVAEAHSRAVELVRAEKSERAERAEDAKRTERAGPGAQVRTAELSEEARRAVDQLPAGERDAILLAYFGGRAYIENTRSDIRRGLLTLRRALEAEGVTT
jgi:RNA polymerase sigma-70 factor, ECF subfamily